MRFSRSTDDEYTHLYDEFDATGGARGHWLRSTVSALGMVLAIGTLGWGWSQIPGHPPALTANLCLPDTEPAKHVVVAIDKTDDFSVDQQRALESSLRAHMRTLALGERMTIFLMTPKGNDITRVLFDRCRPQTEQEADAMTQNPRHIGVAYDEHFVKPFEQALADLKTSQPSDYSPIIEAVYSIAHSAALTEPAKRRVIEIWSDMLNKSVVMNQFQQGYRFESLLRGHSAYIEVAPFTGAEVTVHELVNPHHKRHTAEHSRFWAEYWAHAGVEEKKLVIRRL